MGTPRDAYTWVWDQYTAPCSVLAPCAPQHVPESTTEAAAVMARKHTNTSSKVVIVYLQETTQEKGFMTAACPCRVIVLQQGRVMLSAASCTRLAGGAHKRSPRASKSDALMYNRPKCHCRSLIIFFSHSVSCGSVFPVEQKDNFPTNSPSYSVFTPQGPSHLTAGAAPHQHPPSKPALALGTDAWIYLVHLKML